MRTGEYSAPTPGNLFPSAISDVYQSESEPTLFCWRKSRHRTRQAVLSIFLIIRRLAPATCLTNSDIRQPRAATTFILVFLQQFADFFRFLGSNYSFSNTTLACSNRYPIRRTSFILSTPFPHARLIGFVEALAQVTQNGHSKRLTVCPFFRPWQIVSPSLEPTKPVSSGLQINNLSARLIPRGRAQPCGI